MQPCRQAADREATSSPAAVQRGCPAVRGPRAWPGAQGQLIQHYPGGCGFLPVQMGSPHSPMDCPCRSECVLKTGFSWLVPGLRTKVIPAPASRGQAAEGAPSACRTSPLPRGLISPLPSGLISPLLPLSSHLRQARGYSPHLVQYPALSKVNKYLFNE